MANINARLEKLTPEQRALYDKLIAEKKQQGTEAASDAPTIIPQPAARHEPFPLTDIQQAQWFGRSGLFDITVAGHGYMELACDGMNLGRIQAALRRMIADNEQLRMVVLPNLRQQVLSEVPDYEIAVDDLRGKKPEEVAQALAATRDRMAHAILPATKWPIYEVCASVMDGGKLTIHFSFDLLVGDAWCFRMLLDEWARLYDDLESGRPKPDALTYRDYVLALESLEGTKVYERDLEYWRGQLANLPAPPQLPMVQAPSALKRIVSEHWTIRLQKRDWDSLKGKLRRERLTPSGFFAAALSEIISVWNREPRHALNVTVFNRLPLHADVEKILVGEFNSFLLLAVENGVDASFAERARTLQGLMWQHLEHRWVSGVRLMRELARVRGTGAGESLMPVVFTSTLAHHEGEGNIPTRTLGQPIYEVSQTPQVWMEHHLWEEGGELLLHLDVLKGLFPPGLMKDFVGAYEKLLRRLEADDSAWAEKDGHYLLPEEHRQAWAKYNETDDRTVPGGLLHSAFEQVARANPDQVAVVSSRGTLSYGQLDRKANQLAHWLRAHGAEPNRLVAVVAPKGWEQVAAVLGVVKSGAAYLPIDADSPQERLNAILEDGEVEQVVTTSEVQKKFKWPKNAAVLALDTAKLTDDAVVGPVVRARPEHIAYVIYTSGSTGKPKGVVIDHAGAVNTINDMNRRLSLTSEDRLFGVSSLSFDLSVYDIFGAMSVGATLVMPDQQLPDPRRWVELTQQHGVTLWNSVPALAEMLVGYAEEHAVSLPATLRCFMLSGDWIPLSLPGRLQAIDPALEVISLGGATEASIWSIYYPVEAVEADWTSIPYGMPLTNQRIYVLNQKLQPCPFWVQGDIYIGGIGLAKGYWKDETKTNNAFITHPLTGERLYRTGDLGRFRPEGYVEFMGRNDAQVKVRGYRIELGEIESALARLPGVQTCVVTVHGDSSETAQLAGYVVPEPGAALEQEDMKRELQSSLPNYMVPGTISVIESLPLTANGKVDRKRLAELTAGAAVGAVGYVEPRSLTEEKLASLWAELLKVEKVGVFDNFFQLGGNSLIASRLLYEIHDAFEVELPLSELFEATTVVALAELVERQIVQEVDAMSETEALARAS